jgi:hypothetical protein
MDTAYKLIDKCRYEIQEQKEVPVWYIGTYRPISSTAYSSSIQDLSGDSVGPTS